MAWQQMGLSLEIQVVDGETGAGEFLLRVVDGICKNYSGFEKLITCFLINF